MDKPNLTKYSLLILVLIVFLQTQVSVKKCIATFVKKKWMLQERKKLQRVQ